MTGKYSLLALDAGLSITGGVPPLRNQAGGSPSAESPLPPHGAQSEQLPEGEDELERARR
jgi:hypothetical protein